MKTALLAGVAALALGASGTLALSSASSATPVRTPAVATPSADPCTEPGNQAPSCVVERVLRLQGPSASLSGAAVADDDGTPDQGSGDAAPAAPAPAPTAPGVKLRGDGSVDDSQPGAAPRSAPGVKLRGDGSVDDSQPGAAAGAGDDDGTPDQGRGARPGDDRDDSDDRSGRRGGDHGSDDRDDDRDDDRGGDRGGDDSGRDGSGGSGDDDGTADQGSGDR